MGFEWVYYCIYFCYNTLLSSDHAALTTIFVLFLHPWLLWSSIVRDLWENMLKSFISRVKQADKTDVYKRKYASSMYFPVFRMWCCLFRERFLQHQIKNLELSFSCELKAGTFINEVFICTICQPGLWALSSLKQMKWWPRVVEHA